MEAVNTVTYERPDGGALVAEAQSALATAKGIKIDSAAMYEIVGEELVELKGQIKAIEERHARIKRPILEAGREVDDLFRQPLAIRREAVSAYQLEMTRYRQEQQRIAAEQQAALDRQAREAREQAQREAEALAEAGHTEEAKAVIESAAVISAPTVVADVPKVAGISGRKVWRAKIVDLAKYLHHVADHPELHEWVEAKMQPLNAQATSYHDKLSIPGVIAEEVESTTARTR